MRERNDQLEQVNAQLARRVAELSDENDMLRQQPDRHQQAVRRNIHNEDVFYRLFAPRPARDDHRPIDDLIRENDQLKKTLEGARSTHRAQLKIIKESYEDKLLENRNQYQYQVKHIMDQNDKMQKYESLVDGCYCIKNNEDIIIDARKRINELVVDTNSDMLDETQSFIKETFKLSLLDQDINTLTGIANFITKQMNKVYGSQNTCVVSLGRGIISASDTKDFNHKFECSIGRLHLIVCSSSI